MAAPMSPLIFSLPVMYAVVAFCSPLAILSNVSLDVVIVASALSAAPSVTESLLSLTSTNHWPSPSMSKRYELFMPASFDSSTRDSSPAKKSLAATFPPRRLTGQSEILDRRELRLAQTLRPAREPDREHDGDGRGHGRQPHRRAEVDRVRHRAEDDRADAAETDREADDEAGREPDPPRQVLLPHHLRDSERGDDGRAGEDERRVSRKSAGEHVERDQDRRRDPAREQHRPPPEAVGSGAGEDGSDPAREQHQREQVAPVRLGVAERDLPERDERDEAEPGDAP